jgi:hypothetical protein
VTQPTVAGDCRECGAAGAVRRGYCEVCYAEVDGRAADLPPAVPRSSSPPSGAIPYRMADVIAELRVIATLVGEAEGGPELADALRRTEELLRRLRRQFLDEIVYSPGPGDGRPGSQKRPRAPSVA